ncbi:MAG TPA: inner membrane CreD family protein [Blastocatellia bacterium]|nr:inner membrane CreD family protein [Blastocatellia bacterium]
MVHRITAIVVFYLVAVAGWVFLAGTITYRTGNQDDSIKREVSQLWGTPLEQRAPSARLSVERKTDTEVTNPMTHQRMVNQTTTTEESDLPITQNNIRTRFELDQRQKGLLWYSTYRVHFAGRYVFENPQDKRGEMVVSFTFPSANGQYDEFKFEMDGSPVPFTRGKNDVVVARIICEPKARHELFVTYLTQGLDRFVYRFGDGITEVRNFQMVAVTENFDRYDFPQMTLSPTTKERAGGGWELTWNYADLISGNGIGVEMPQKINPGPMAARISFFAPVSLGFFFFLIFIISVLKKIELHPMNYFFLAASFFAFHLLLAYLVDHISIHAAFVICSMVSLILVVSYMRLVVGNRFAFFETALAQTVYLIGFSYAFFFEGFTGLAVAIGVISTLFVVMQMTARINWSEKFRLAGAGVKELDKP